MHLYHTAALVTSRSAVRVRPKGLILSTCSPQFTEQLGEGVQTCWRPTSPKSCEKEPWPRFLVLRRRRIKTVIGQLVERYRAEKFGAAATFDDQSKARTSLTSF